MDEETFWRRMNPARLYTLYTVHFGLPKEAPKTEPEEKPISLSAYLRGG